ncbi:MAG: fructose-bisphosphatase class III [Lachnospiraceae bacterium]|nr:fructose-bisphosphatase class III [Lachnospiraceae bacterium]
MGYTYVMSDIHGMYEAYLRMLEKIELKEEDTLYILGDVIDRGPSGIQILDDIMKRDNVTLLLRNHEVMMLEVITLENLSGPAYQTGMYRWEKNGGGSTAKDYFENLSYKEQAKMIAYLEACPLFLTLDVEGKKFYLVHAYPDLAGIADAVTDPVVTFNSLCELSIEETDNLESIILWKRMEREEDFKNHPYVIFGHTPTLWYQDTVPMTCWHGKNVTNVDCGCSYLANGWKEGQLGCLRLEDMKEFYVR